MKMTASEVIRQVTDILAEADGEFIEHIANEVLGRKVKYEGDSLFSFADAEEVEGV